jgi:cytochrome c oxidase subunit 2
MTTLFIVLILIFITIAIWQMIKIFDLSKAISGIKIDNSQIANDEDNKIQAKLMLGFLAFIYALLSFLWSNMGSFR